MSGEVTVTTTKTAKISGSGQLTGSVLKEFASTVPDFATIKLKEDRYVEDRPYGYTYPWEITATWNE